jgi:hypothetical protein
LKRSGKREQSSGWTTKWIEAKELDWLHTQRL